MKIFGLEITRAKAQPQSLDTGRGGWYPVIRESFPGAWQRNVEVNHNSVLAYDALFACMTLIAGDISKNRVKLVAQETSGIWTEVANPSFSPVLRKPNRFQTRIQFFENWVLSKLQRGNAYILKERDNRGVVVAMYVLDPQRVTPKVTPDGAVYYELKADNMAGLEEDRLLVPASEIIHDRFNCLFHPLVGISPIYASGLAATQGLRIQENSVNLFANGGRPSGLLIAPGKISAENAETLKNEWEAKYTGANTGKVAVLGDGLKFETLAMKAADAQLIEQLKWTAEVVCSVFHVPPYKIGLRDPTFNNVQALNVEYYSQCLQVLFESIELCLDEGLGIGQGVNTNGTVYGTEFDTDNLLRMDTATQIEVIEKAKSVLTLDERRRKLDFGKITGGDTVYLQQQDHSIEAISARDKLLIEQAEAGPVAPPPANDDEPTEAERAQQRAASMALLEKRVRERLNA
jgi:HK97 family phage portal protein